MDLMLETTVSDCLIDELEAIIVHDVSRLFEAIHDAPNRLPVLVDLPRDAGDGISWVECEEDI
ncbi:hypothetical protein C441_04224 [Haloferax sulfurifontis ATCC BAA-897]|uniref:Uncharacterized protein n=1 Tax=Haloferax sulfurifontis ATCC BAA-897 TaxID=662480 RepID=M0IKZ4_9EURY|nr:hypothetical protein [Haloferax sulfurifontis]ELZ96717.1 hypothetical protein C441_04224 [Haloferax sulfurifontis ATCC BAA-897]